MVNRVWQEDNSAIEWHGTQLPAGRRKTGKDHPGKICQDADPGRPVRQRREQNEEVTVRKIVQLLVDPECGKIRVCQDSNAHC
jgi:hypothetical protein